MTFSEHHCLMTLYGRWKSSYSGRFCFVKQHMSVFSLLLQSFLLDSFFAHHFHWALPWLLLPPPSVNCYISAQISAKLLLPWFFSSVFTIFSQIGILVVAVALWVGSAGWIIKQQSPRAEARAKIFTRCCCCCCCSLIGTIVIRRVNVCCYHCSVRVCVLLHVRAHV